MTTSSFPGFRKDYLHPTHDEGQFEITRDGDECGIREGIATGANGAAAANSAVQTLIQGAPEVLAQGDEVTGG